ncbi:MAG: hypothetical protein WCC39_03520 [Telluria sp.]
MADNKDKSQQGKQEVAGQSGEQNMQGGKQAWEAAQAAGGDGSRQSGFLHSSPEAQVFPAGKPQADNGGKHRGGDSAAGTPDESRMGGSGGTSAAGTTGNDPDR